MRTAMHALQCVHPSDAARELHRPIVAASYLLRRMASWWYFRASDKQNAASPPRAQHTLSSTVVRSGCAVSVAHGRSIPAPLEGGMQLPYCPLYGSAEPSSGRSIYDVVSTATYTLLCFAHSEHKPSVSMLVDKLCNEFTARRVQLVTPYTRIRATNARASLRACARQFLSVDIMVVRPDRVIAWCDTVAANATIAQLDALAVHVASTLTGKTARMEGYMPRDRILTEESHLAWLRAQFLRQLHPYQLHFPQAIKVRNQTKAEAWSHVRPRSTMHTPDTDQRPPSHADTDVADVHSHRLSTSSTSSASLSEGMQLGDGGGLQSTVI
eukprot:m.1642097 g.1642097  ORF g.1642097 m.1642097 type:complete len:326 (-) comp51555_c0_seq1:194-1171(-)